MVEIDSGPFLLNLGSLILSWHGVFSFIAVASAVFLVGRWAPMRGLDPDDIYSIAVWGIIGGIIGARLVHVID
ncbi:MAG TPA: prolipoprotein diacylglyceryl transferase, partial [Dehalococcoidia bacterium]|nr:prolipoprotein diacylglyceryl transferase [Dehalococcoidia bacterium]